MNTLKLILFAFLCNHSISVYPAALNYNIKTEVGSDLPVVITRSKTETGDKFLLLISGDGGWNSFDQQLADTYAANGISVVGLNSLKYFWKKKTPQEAANDVASLLKKYSLEWKKKQAVLCGYSFGAEVIPFIYRRLPNELKDKISLVQLLSPASFTDFEVHISDLLGAKDPVRSMNIASEIKLMDVPVICYYGDLEQEKPLTGLKKDNFRILILKGDHHYKNSFTEIVRNALNISF